MSRYVTKKNGIRIGSDNVFFYKDENDEIRDFPCIVSIAPLFFDNYSTHHAFIRSTAEQLLFNPGIYTDNRFGYEETKTMYRLDDWWVRWLDANCPGWGYPPPHNSDRVPCLFFAKRKHALAFANEVARILQGERYR